MLYVACRHQAQVSGSEGHLQSYRGLPIVLAGTFTGALKRLRSLGQWSSLIEKARGVIIVGVGLYFVDCLKAKERDMLFGKMTCKFDIVTKLCALVFNSLCEEFASHRPQHNVRCMT